ncbi:GLPGLI family protein [Zhouia sp. PK063]|uniref:GLPGLI family protein n=1 Tax=Zhouia sp. PK063 TaxID=3373602 RepID=UPI0037965035
MKIVKYLVVLVGCLAFQHAQSQSFSGVATYQSVTSMKEFEDRAPRDMSAEQRKRMEDFLKRQLNKTYVLTFDKESSIYKEDEQLTSPDAGGRRGMFGAMNSTGDYYKNVSTGMLINQREFFGKNFLIKDSLPKLDWKLTGETKKIGQYNCYKATATKTMPSTEMFRPRRGGDNNDEAQNDAPKEVTITAWYTMDIPVKQGPGEYWGLPGLILEVSDGRTVLLCSTITLNPSDKEEIEVPSKGKEVTQDEFNDIMVKKMKEVRENFRNRRGGGGFGGRLI